MFVIPATPPTSIEGEQIVFRMKGFFFVCWFFRSTPPLTTNFRPCRNQRYHRHGGTKKHVFNAHPGGKHTLNRDTSLLWKHAMQPCVQALRIYCEATLSWFFAFLCLNRRWQKSADHQWGPSKKKKKKLRPASVQSHPEQETLHSSMGFPD